MGVMNDKPLDRFARGELSPAEQRELAQQSLSDRDLFDELTEAAVAGRNTADRHGTLVRWPRIAGLAAAAAAIAVVALLAPKRVPQPVTPSVSTAAPTLLAGAGAPGRETFRGTDAVSREPRTTGSILSIADGTAALDLGTVDGLSKDAVVEVFRNGRSAGHLKLTTIFRDHARGEATDGAVIAPNDQVRVPPAAQLRATLDRIAASLARGETEKAMSIAQQASADPIDAQLTGGEDLNNAGVIAELHGDRNMAAGLYRRALQTNPSAPDRQAIERNLARLKGE